MTKDEASDLKALMERYLQCCLANERTGQDLKQAKNHLDDFMTKLIAKGQ